VGNRRRGKRHIKVKNDDHHLKGEDGEDRVKEGEIGEKRGVKLRR